MTLFYKVRNRRKERFGEHESVWFSFEPSELETSVGCGLQNISVFLRSLL